MMRQVLDAATVNLRQLAKWAGVSYETARSWRLGRRAPNPRPKRKLARALRAHAARLQRLAVRLERSAGRDG